MTEPISPTPCRCADSAASIQTDRPQSGSFEQLLDKAMANAEGADSRGATLRIAYVEVQLANLDALASMASRPGTGSAPSGESLFDVLWGNRARDSKETLPPRLPSRSGNSSPVQRGLQPSRSSRTTKPGNQYRIQPVPQPKDSTRAIQEPQRRASTTSTASSERIGFSCPA